MNAALRPELTKFRYQPNLDVPKKEAEDQWLALCERHRKAVDSLVVRWIDDPSVYSENQEEQFLLSVRFYSVGRFSALHAFVRGGAWTSAFPLPGPTEKEVLSMLLLDWWWGVGVFLSFDDGWMAKMEA